MKKIHLGDAACVADRFALCLDVHQHLGDSSGGKTDVCEGQVGKEEVHGRVEVGVSPDHQQHRQLPHHGQEVNHQEEHKEQSLDVGVV